ncbi:MAG: beta-alanine degradation protein BauB [Acidobacteriota bacterium]|nr:beta-alanine degradation protein BauB [Acidobacteriota bacterium]
MNCSIRAKVGFALLAVLCFAASASAQDPARVAPRIYKVRLNNPWIRVLEFSGNAGEKARLHAHPDYVVYVLSDSRIRFADAKGTSTEADMKAGEAMWRGAERHSSEVLTDNSHGLLFELKGPKRAARARPARSDDPVTVDPGHYKVLLDNERVRVIEFRAAAGEKSPMHSHPNYVTYNFSGGRTTFTYPRGKPFVATSKAGDVLWHKAETHAGQVGDTESHVLIVELK